MRTIVLSAWLFQPAPCNIVQPLREIVKFVCMSTMRLYIAYVLLFAVGPGPVA